MKLEVSYSEKGVIFTRTLASGRVEALSGDFAFVEPIDEGKAIDVLKHEVGQRGNVTRAALTSLVHILQSDMMGGHKGQGNINDSAGLPKGLKADMRAAEDAYFRPRFKDTKKAGEFIATVREAGIYATVKGACLKYFYFAGKLPCMYNTDGTPDTGKMLSVSAMQKLLANMQDDRQTKDDSIATRILSLQAEWREKTDLTKADLQLILGNLTRFAADVQQTINVMDAHATETTANILPPGAQVAEAVEVDAAAIMKAWAEKEELEAAYLSDDADQ